MIPIYVSIFLFLSSLLTGLILPANVPAEANRPSETAGTNKRLNPTAGPIIYHPPTRGAPGGRIGGGTRGVDRAVHLAVLAPDHTALTGREQPTLYWYVSEPVSSAITFTLIDEGISPILEQTLTPPFTMGIHRIRLSDRGVRLAPGKQYRWYITLIHNSLRQSHQISAGATIEHVDYGKNETPDVGNDIGATLQYMAGAGQWYDVIELLSDQIESHPSEMTFRAQRANLLEQVGLAEIAAFDLK